MSSLRVAHFMNQFFAGIGGEESADMPVQGLPGPVGPGIQLQRALGEEATVVGTLVCGDNYFTERTQEALVDMLRRVEELRPDVLVAGPAFSAGRYGMACGALCEAAQRPLGIPAVTAMHPENPGADQRLHEVYVLPTTLTAVGMAEALDSLAAFALRLGRGEDIGPASTDGYLPRGVRKNLRVGTSASERAVDMLLARLKDQSFETEILIPEFDQVLPPAPIADLSTATVAVVTESGLVPCGNPDRLETWNATKWLRYSVVGRDDLKAGEFEAWHGGCDTRATNDDPDRVVPLDALRWLERNGTIGRLYDDYFVTTGNMSSISIMTRLGSEIAEELRSQNVDAALLVAT